MAKEDEIRPTAFTLRFKYGKQTILLFAEPFTPLSTIKKELLEVLHEIYPNGLSSSNSQEHIPIPHSPLEIRLGVPENVYEPSMAGWKEIETSDLMQTPKEAGLKDGSILAFSFLGQSGQPADFSVEWSSYDEQDPEEDTSMTNAPDPAKGKERV